MEVENKDMQQNHASMNCSKHPQYCNNGKKKSKEELAKMRSNTSTEVKPKPSMPQTSISSATITSNNANETVTLSSMFLYRAVSSGELNDIFNSQSFRPNPTVVSMDAKWFWETLDGAKGFQQEYTLDAVVKVTTPDEVMEFASSTSENLDNLGPAVSFIDEGLDAFNELFTEIEIVSEEVGPFIP
jgi:hypothetical protein